MRWQHAVIWRLKQKPGTQLCFFDICVGLVSVVGRVRGIVTPSLCKIAPKEPVRKLPMRASLPRTAIRPQGLRILSRLERTMSCSSRYPGRFGDESRLLPQKPDPQCCFFDKTPVICERSSDPAMICDKHLGHSLLSSFPNPHHPDVAPSVRYCHKSLIRNVSSLTKHWSPASAHRIR
jgi:hypothetical protein